jgi:2-hydroxychromene-2-carboxylate isomerase
MGIKAFVVSRVADALMGETRLLEARAKAEASRKKAGAPHLISYFHQVDDPYSQLAVQALAILAARYKVEIAVYLVGPPADWATPERAFLNEYARLDAARLAQASGLSFPAGAMAPNTEAIGAAQSAISAILNVPDCLQQIVKIGTDLWAGKSVSTELSTQAVETSIAQGQAERERLGHFMSAMIHYGGEWYWGLDRLHYLEKRLVGLGLLGQGATNQAIWLPPLTPRLDAHQSGRTTPVIEFFLSFRSPYTYIATKRAKALADAYGAELRLRFVLPMVMRGLAVPPIKSRYFSLDTAREARRLGVPFGKICDPLGKPVERGYALLPWAIAQGKGYEFCLSFMEKVWSQGVDAGTDAGLENIVVDAGLDWNIARSLIGNDDWRSEAEDNRLALLELGHWGVPCFKLGGTIVWGQDRLWVIEDAMRQAR